MRTNCCQIRAVGGGPPSWLADGTKWPLTSADAPPTKQKESSRAEQGWPCSALPGENVGFQLGVFPACQKAGGGQCGRAGQALAITSSLLSSRRVALS